VLVASTLNDAESSVMATRNGDGSADFASQGTVVAVDLEMGKWAKSSTQYAIVVDAGFVFDAKWNAFEGVGPLSSSTGAGASATVTASNAKWKLETADWIAPVATSVMPMQGTRNISVGLRTVEIEFDEPIARGSTCCWAVELWEKGGSAAVESFGASSSSLLISGSTLRIQFSTSSISKEFTTYEVRVSPTAIVDLSGDNFFAGIDAGSW